ncbi:Thiamin pyrophosphokinase [Catenaria anguillulae PL171]|uniref:Thiamin pyrophosphokinase n=1 Tax=Catenaria anguillulae PL171 TaxID=765915 RepID=A0A1Y2H3X2_9FUNG|nr:Thiamin pyrophosphokinase [Catenaria anguillulae PL171]
MTPSVSVSVSASASASADDQAIMPTPSPSPPPAHACLSQPSATMQTHSLLHYLRPSTPQPRFALVVVNRPLTHLPTSLLVDLWLNAEWRLCADGGANQLYDRLAHDPALQRRLIPHIIAGDLDSVRPDVVEFYRQLGAKIHKSTCQNSTDLGKCIQHMESIERHLKIPVTLDLVILGGTDGRFDQTLGVVHSMHAIACTGRKVALLDAHNFMTVLTPATVHRLDVVHPMQGPHCGLLPVGAPTVVSTRGLVWDMERFLLSFATVISACNQVDRAYTAVDVPQEWVARSGSRVKPGQVNVTFDDLERAMATTKLASSDSANHAMTSTTGHTDERVDLTCAPTAVNAATAYALTPFTPTLPLSSSSATNSHQPSAPGASPPVSPTLLRKEPPSSTMTKSARSPSLSSLEPVPPALLEGESVSHVFVETTQPVVWTVEVNFASYAM